VTLTDFLIGAVVVLLLVRIVQSWQQHRALVKWLDALGDLHGDMLRAILDEVRKGKQ